MILSYDSVLGVPIVESSGENTSNSNSNNMGINLGVPALLLLAVIIILFVTLFSTLGKNLADQYSKVQVYDDVNLNGEFTLGENIGDLGGINAAYDGLQLYFKENGRPDDIDGFTAEQRFFMSWATVWRTKMREEALRNLIKTDPHAPAMYRSYMPLQNVDSFYTAFDIKEGDKMFLEPEDRVKIW